MVRESCPQAVSGTSRKYYQNKLGESQENSWLGTQFILMVLTCEAVLKPQLTVFGS